MTARPDEVVAWQERYRNTDTGDWLAWRECSRFTHESYVASGHNFPEYETRALTDAAALQSANARLADVLALADKWGNTRRRYTVEGHVRRDVLMKCAEAIRRAAAGEGDGND